MGRRRIKPTHSVYEIDGKTKWKICGNAKGERGVEVSIKHYMEMSGQK